MKKLSSLILCFLPVLFVTGLSAQGLIISEIADGTGPGGYPKIVEITNTGTSDATLDGMKLKLYTNGNTVVNTTYIISSFTLPGGQSLVLTNGDNTTAGQLWTDFNLTEPAYVLYSVNAVNSNGDDVYEFTDAFDVVVDVYGDVGTDGTGQNWEFLDSYAYRNSDIIVGNQTFTESEWTFAGADFLDPYFTDLSPYLTPGTHNYISPTAPLISNIFINPVSPTSADQVSVAADVVAQGTATITSVDLYWGTSPGVLGNHISMSLAVGNTYVTSSLIPAQVDGTTVYYKVEATDDTPETSSTIEFSYYIGTTPPDIYMINYLPNPVSSADNVSVSAEVTDDGTVASVNLFWGLDGISFPNQIGMTLSTGSTYTTNTDIPAQSVGTTVYFFIEAIDDTPDTSISSTVSYTVIQQPGSYLFLNGDFEDWTAGVADEWTLVDDSILVYEEPVIVHGGLRSARFTLITPDQNDADFRQMVSVTSGAIYDYTVWVYQTDSLARVRFYIDGFPNIYSDPQIIGSWQLISGSYTAPATADIEVGLRFYDMPSFVDSSIIYVDDYSFDFHSDVAAVRNTSNDPVLFPNPAGDHFAVSNTSDIISLIITDISGQALDVLSNKGQNSIVYDAGQLDKGIYIITCIHTSGMNTSFKLVKN
ncbi:MAG: lamin tail domain-containing protein [Bacteroidota bacterium]